jgi:hypothetical protein
MNHQNLYFVLLAITAMSCAPTNLVAPATHPANPNAEAGRASELPVTLAKDFDPHQAYAEPTVAADPHAHHRSGGMAVSTTPHAPESPANPQADEESETP